MEFGSNDPTWIHSQETAIVMMLQCIKCLAPDEVTDFFHYVKNQCTRFWKQTRMS